MSLGRGVNLWIVVWGPKRHQDSIHPHCLKSAGSRIVHIIRWDQWSVGGAGGGEQYYEEQRQRWLNVTNSNVSTEVKQSQRSSVRKARGCPVRLAKDIASWFCDIWQRCRAGNGSDGDEIIERCCWLTAFNGLLWTKYATQLSSEVPILSQGLLGAPDWEMRDSYCSFPTD